MNHARLHTLIAMACHQSGLRPSMTLAVMDRATRQLTQRWPLVGCRLSATPGAPRLLILGRNE